MKAFQQLQVQFAAHLRDPSRPAPRGIEPRRMKIYAELFYNNVEGFLRSTFPVLRKITKDTDWHAMVRDFYARHRSSEPLFLHIPREFLDYLAHERPAKQDPPYLRELAHYEWVELALAQSLEEIRDIFCDPEGDLLEGVPVLSPLAWSLAYDFPVHRISPQFLPKAKDPVHLVIWRNRGDDVKFMEANAVTARLLELMKGGRSTGRALLQRLARELKHADPALVISEGAAILKGLAARDIVLGTKARKISKRKRR